MIRWKLFSGRRWCLRCPRSNIFFWLRRRRPTRRTINNNNWPRKNLRRYAFRANSGGGHGAGLSIWRKVLACGIFMFCLYIVLLAYVSFVAITNHRNNNFQAYRFQDVNKNGSLIDVNYDGREAVQIGLSESAGVGLITFERVGGSPYHLYSRKDANIIVADMLRSQTIFKCVSVHFRKEFKPPIALVSFPGSGNTWLRYLLQLATGVFTGSIYKDFALLRNGFPGESMNDGRVLVVKTHEIGLLARAKFQKAVLLLRRPSEAILAEFNRRAAGHVGHAGRDKYTRNNGLYWSQFVAHKAKAWTETNLDWIEHFNGPLLITMYTHLVRNTSEELSSILNFLEEAVSDKVMLCVLENKEGIYRRRRRFERFNPFSEEMEKFLDSQERIVAEAIRRRMLTRHNLLHPPNQIVSSQRNELLPV